MLNQLTTSLDNNYQDISGHPIQEGFYVDSKDRLRYIYECENRWFTKRDGREMSIEICPDYSKELMGLSDLDLTNRLKRLRKEISFIQKNIPEDLASKLIQEEII